jgi:hypothetical protein
MIKSQPSSGNLVDKPYAATKAEKSSGHKKKPTVSNTHPNEFLALLTSRPPALKDRITRPAWGGEARRSEDVSFSGLNRPPAAMICRFPA